MSDWGFGIHREMGAARWRPLRERTHGGLGKRALPLFERVAYRVMSSDVRPIFSSGLMSNTIPGSVENCSVSDRNRCSASHRNPVCLHPGILFAFTPESCSAWTGIAKYNRKPARCHPTTGSGFTMTRASAHRDQTCRSIVQKIRSERFSFGRGRFRLSTASCWRNARTSRATSHRLRKNTRNAQAKERMNSSINSPLYHAQTSQQRQLASC